VGKTVQLWISKGLEAALDNPKKVQAVVVRSKDKHFLHLTSVRPDAEDENILSVSQGGYMSGERLWTLLNELFDNPSMYYKPIKIERNHGPRTIVLAPEKQAKSKPEPERNGDHDSK
jgi:hypothetical protein